MTAFSPPVSPRSYGFASPAPFASPDTVALIKRLQDPSAAPSVRLLGAGHSRNSSLSTDLKQFSNDGLLARRPSIFASSTTARSHDSGPSGSHSSSSLLEPAGARRSSVIQSSHTLSSDVNALGAGGRRILPDTHPLIKACKRGDAIAIRSLLDELTVEQRLELVNARDKNGSTSIFHTVWNGYYAALEVLLQSGANPNIQNSKLNTALHLAAEQSHINIITLLLSYDANPHLLNFQGKCSYETAKDPEVQATVENTMKAMWLQIQTQKMLGQAKATPGELKQNAQADTTTKLIAKKAAPLYAATTPKAETLRQLHTPMLKQLFAVKRSYYTRRMGQERRSSTIEHQMNQQTELLLYNLQQKVEAQRLANRMPARSMSSSFSASMKLPRSSTFSSRGSRELPPMSPTRSAYGSYSVENELTDREALSLQRAADELRHQTSLYAEVDAQQRPSTVAGTLVERAVRDVHQKFSGKTRQLLQTMAREEQRRALTTAPTGRRSAVTPQQRYAQHEGVGLQKQRALTQAIPRKPPATAYPTVTSHPHQRSISHSPSITSALQQHIVRTFAKQLTDSLKPEVVQSVEDQAYLEQDDDEQDLYEYVSDGWAVA